MRSPISQERPDDGEDVREFWMYVGAALCIATLPLLWLLHLYDFINADLKNKRL